MKHDRRYINVTTAVKYMDKIKKIKMRQNTCFVPFNGIRLIVIVGQSQNNG